MEEHQSNILKYLKCPYSGKPITKICVDKDCREMNPLICSECQMDGCAGNHIHNSIRNHADYQDIKARLQKLKPSAERVDQHLRKVRQELQRIVSDLQIMISQHEQFMSSRNRAYPNQKTTLILKNINQNKWGLICGSNIDYIFNEQFSHQKSNMIDQIEAQKVRIFRTFDTIRKNIGDYYYKKQKKSIKHYLNEAMEKMNQKNYDEAILQYTNVLDLYPYNEDALCYRGLCYSSIKEYKKALEDYSTCLSISPRHSQAMNNMGYIFSLMKQRPMAVVWFNKSLNLDPNNPNTLHNRAMVLMSMSRYEQAKPDFLRAIQLEPCQDYYEKLAMCEELIAKNQKKK